MRIVLDNKLALADAPDALREEVRTRLTMVNPAFAEAERMGRWTGKIPRVLRFYETDPNSGLIVPRGYTGHLVRLARQFGVQCELADRRRQLPEAHFRFRGALREYQERAVRNVMAKDFGTLEAPTGSGKTIMALAVIANRRQPALIVVHTRELLNQWIDRIEAFLGIPRDQIGVIGGGKYTIGSKVTVALVQSLYKCAGEVAPRIGHLVVDECHRTPSRTFTEAVTAFDCKYMLGLSATPWRRDKLSRLIFLYLGDIQHRIDAAQLIEDGNVLREEVVWRETAFRATADPSAEYSKMLAELTQDDKRNRLVALDVAEATKSGAGVCLVLSDRKQHCETLAALLRDENEIDAHVLTGDTPTKERQQIVEQLNSGDIRVLVATGQLIGEGFDCKALSTLFLATPLKFDGRLLQYLGRVLRPAPGKTAAKVYDYIDTNVGPLLAAAKARQRVYSRRFNPPGFTGHT